jgi:hypothetical protein
LARNHISIKKYYLGASRFDASAEGVSGMFWGHGDSSKLSSDERVELDKLRRLVESGHLMALSPDQTKIALAAINFYGTVTATSGLLVGIRNVFYWVAGFAAFWWMSKDAVVTFLKTAIAAG